MTCASVVLGLLLSLAGSAHAAERLPAVLHVHSTLSTGELSLEDVARMAEDAGVAVVFLAENYLLRIEYGLPPFRALTRVAREEPSVTRLGLHRYLARVADARRRFPGLVIVPGVEVLPQYRWTGSPLSLSMTLHDTQKNILVFGVTDPATLASLPSSGTVRAGEWTLQSLLDALPLLLIVPGAWALATKRTRRVRVSRAIILLRQRRSVLGGVLCAVALAALVRGWPFTADRYPSWTDAGLVPHQELIDHVARLGGVTIWSFPDAKDAGERFVGPVHVAWRTDPYGDDLLRTSRYTAFGGVYEDTTRFERPGQGWDLSLGQYVRGERSQPAWAVGESGFHGAGAGKRIGAVQTVFLGAERSEAGALDALRRGRMYALRRSRHASLVLTELAVDAGGQGSAESGATLAIPAGTPVEVRIGIDATGGSQPVRVALVRNGAVVAGWTGTTPFRAVHREAFDGAAAFFRVDAWGAGAEHRLLTNPIFVKAM